MLQVTTCKSSAESLPQLLQDFQIQSKHHAVVLFASVLLAQQHSEVCMSAEHAASCDQLTLSFKFECQLTQVLCCLQVTSLEQDIINVRADLITKDDQLRQLTQQAASEDTEAAAEAAAEVKKLKSGKNGLQAQLECKSRQLKVSYSCGCVSSCLPCRELPGLHFASSVLVSHPQQVICMLTCVLWQSWHAILPATCCSCMFCC